MSGVNINNLAYTSTDFKDADLIEVFRSSDSKNTHATGAVVKAAALATVVAAAPWASASNTKTIKTATADYAILDSDGYYLFTGDTTTAAKRITFTLPTLADNIGRTMEFKVIGAGGVLVSGEGAETISGLASISLYTDGDRLELIATATEWKVLGCLSRISTGGINTADWSVRHFGNRNLAYDGLSGTFVIGELVTEYSDAGYTTPTGKTGRICTDSGSVLVLRDVTGGGTFTNDYYIKGSSSLATARPNHATAIKNQDSNVYHGFGVNITNIKSDFLIVENATFTFTSAYKISGHDGAVYGAGIRQVDTNNIEWIGATNGINIIVTGGGEIVLTNQDYSYNVITKLEL